jgi:hypothetical protein
MSTSNDGDSNDNNISTTNNGQEGDSDIFFKNTKKKQRYSRAVKRQRKEQQVLEQQLVGQDGTNRQQNREHQDRPMKLKRNTKKTKVSVLERIQKCIEESLHTGSVLVETNRTEITPSTIGIVSGCDWNESKRRFPSETIAATTVLPSRERTIRVQPLLILDLNGILCHRSRPGREPPNVTLRPSMGTVAQTPVVPRQNLQDLLHELDEHFCLAVWTSAKRKTSRMLVDMLFPPQIRQRLLFVWAQNNCDAVVVEPEPTTTTTDMVSADGDASSDSSSDSVTVDDHEQHEEHSHPSTRTEDNTVYEKNLRKVWDAYPLWSANNTLLVDDSPDKCPFAVANAIHPPRLHGRTKDCQSLQTVTASTTTTTTTTRPNGAMSDEDNERMQAAFFEQLVQFWSRQPYKERVFISGTVVDGTNRDVDGRLGGSLEVRETMTNRQYYQFLESHAQSEMGWRPV